MGTIGAILGGIGGLCAVLGIVIATEITTMPLGEQFTWVFWFMLSAILLLGSIATTVGHGGSRD